MNGSLEHIQCDESDGSVQHRTTSKRKDFTKNIDTTTVNEIMNQFSQTCDVKVQVKNK